MPLTLWVKCFEIGVGFCGKLCVFFQQQPYLLIAANPLEEISQSRHNF